MTRQVIRHARKVLRVGAPRPVLPPVAPEARLARIRESLRSDTRFWFDRMMASDQPNPGAASHLAESLPNETVADAAVAMFHAACPVPNFREVFLRAWTREQRELLVQAENRERVFAMFRRAEFSLPADLPDVVPVWRGIIGKDVDAGKAGLSWTRSRQSACYFACIYWKVKGFKGVPAVLRREVSRADIVFCRDDGAEDEVVFDSPPAGEIDGTQAEWRAAAVALEMEMARARAREGSF